MHQQEVRRIVLATLVLRYACCHRHCRHTCRTDQRIDLLVGILDEQVHQLSQQNTTCRTASKRYDTHYKDTQSLPVDECICGCSCTNGDTQEDNNDVHQLVLNGLAQTLYNAALLHQVTEHQAANQRCCAGQQQSYDNSDNDREDDLLLLRYGTQLSHTNLTLALSGQQSHNGRLDHGNQRHIRVCCNCDRTKQLGSQLRGQVDSGRAVSTTDNTDRSSLSLIEAQSRSTDESQEDTHLSSCTKQEALGVSDQRTEIGHSTYAEEDQAGIDTQLNTQIEVVQQTSVVHKDIPVNVAACEQLRVEHIRTRKVGEQHTECDGKHQHRLILLHDCQIHQQERYGNHNIIAPVAYRETHLAHEVHQAVENVS